MCKNDFLVPTFGIILRYVCISRSGLFHDVGHRVVCRNVDKYTTPLGTIVNDNSPRLSLSMVPMRVLEDLEGRKLQELFRTPSLRHCMRPRPPRSRRIVPPVRHKNSLLVRVDPPVQPRASSCRSSLPPCSQHDNLPNSPVRVDPPPVQPARQPPKLPPKLPSSCRSFRAATYIARVARKA